MSDRWSTRSPGARRRPSSGKSLRVRRGPPARAAGPSCALGAPSTPPAGAGGRTGSGLGSSVCSDFAVCGPARPPSVSPRVREASGLWVQEKGEETGRQDGRTARLRPLGRCPCRIGVPPRARPSSFPGKGLRFPDALRGRKSSRNSTALDEAHGARKRPRSILDTARSPGCPGVPGGGQALLPRAPGAGAVSAPGARTEPSGTGRRRRSRAAGGARGHSCGGRAPRRARSRPVRPRTALARLWPRRPRPRAGREGSQSPLTRPHGPAGARTGAPA